MILLRRGVAGILLPANANVSTESSLCGPYINSALQGISTQTAAVLGHVGYTILNGWIAKVRSQSAELRRLNATWLVFEDVFPGVGLVVQTAPHISPAGTQSFCCRRKIAAACTDLLQARPCSAGLFDAGIMYYKDPDFRYRVDQLPPTRAMEPFRSAARVIEKSLRVHKAEAGVSGTSLRRILKRKAAQRKRSAVVPVTMQ